MSKGLKMKLLCSVKHNKTYVLNISFKFISELCVLLNNSNLNWCRMAHCLYWSDSTKRCWTISLPGMRWGSSGSLDTLGYEVIRSPTSLQGVALF